MDAAEQLDAFVELRDVEYRSLFFTFCRARKSPAVLILPLPVETAIALALRLAAIDLEGLEGVFEGLLVALSYDLPLTWIKFRCTCLLLFENGAF